MNDSESRVVKTVLFAVMLVFAYLGGFLISNAEWFRPVKTSLYSFLQGVGLARFVQ